MLQSLFNKVSGIRACNFTKKENLKQVFSCEIFKHSFFNRTPPVTASVVLLTVLATGSSELIFQKQLLFAISLSLLE